MACQGAPGIWELWSVECKFKDTVLKKKKKKNTVLFHVFPLPSYLKTSHSQNIY